MKFFEVYTSPDDLHSQGRAKFCERHVHREHTMPYLNAQVTQISLRKPSHLVTADCRLDEMRLAITSEEQKHEWFPDNFQPLPIDGANYIELTIDQYVISFVVLMT